MTLDPLLLSHHQLAAVPGHHRQCAGADALVEGNRRQQTRRILILTRLKCPFEPKKVGIDNDWIDRDTVARHMQKAAFNRMTNLPQFEQALTQTCLCMRFEPARPEQLA